MEDYLTKFLSGKRFDLSRLLDEDYLQAFKLCCNRRRYASATKLLLIFIDTLAYLEYGDQAGNFQLWLKTFANMDETGLTVEEVWEFRNAILHSTTNESRKIRRGKCKRLVLYVGHVHPSDLPSPPNEKPFGLFQVFHAVTDAVEVWGKEMGNRKDWLNTFIERYDHIISDARYLECTWEE